MAETVELGGNIALTGFSDVDGTSMVILKKIIGGYAKEVSEKNMDFKRLEFMLNRAEPYELEGVLTAKRQKKASASNSNLFIALGDVLDKLKK